MPKIFEYLGIIFFFYSNEHYPIHVHARKGEFESKAEFLIENGVIVEIVITNVQGSEPLNGSDLKEFRVFLKNFSKQIVDKWVDYFVYNKSVSCEKITKRLK